MFVGLQGSGKSTFYRAFFEETHVLVSKDRFRNNRNPQRRQMQLIEQALAEGRSVVVDNTNPAPDDRAPILALAGAFGAGAVGYFFEAKIGDCLARNRLREGKGRVPDRALYITRNRLVAPTHDEGFDRLFAVRISSGGFLVRAMSGGAPLP